MLQRLLQRVFKHNRKGASKKSGKNITVQRATELMFRGDTYGAISLFKDYLQTDPYHVQALNDLGCCLISIGDMAGATTVFELACSLDDTFTLGVTNYANMLKDQRRSAEALQLLKLAKFTDLESPHVNSVYAGVSLILGDALTAKKFALKAWLANFDKLRNANCYLVYGAYGDFDETEVAIEHQFWAETLLPIDLTELENNRTIKTTTANLIAREQLTPSNITPATRLRIGYWSPDFRNHSVRYFFRPLLEGHNSDRVETFLYHDFPVDDTQTELISAACDHFHDICDFSDTELMALIRSHQLDVLVELTGHMSHNRVSLLQQRLATVQLSGLGYPPTTGLKTVDAKIIDRYIASSRSQQYYVESEMILPNSFWCFDPMSEAKIVPHPPSLRNGYITFACVGNTAKITPTILKCWKDILEDVPKSRLLIRSHTFVDSSSELAISNQFQAIGIALDRVDFKQPENGDAFLDSYNQIDIVLDTYPFNGGTTTCFATYMGVPVVSWFGESLISRMGLSVLSNLGTPELATHSADAYKKCAISLSNDPDFLQKFRVEARVKFKRSSLGNGNIFAKEFEDACEVLLQQKKTDPFKYKQTVPLLPADEIIRRAFAVLRYGQPEASKRIVDYCLANYPDCGSAHIFIAQQKAAGQQFEEGAKYLMSRMSHFSEKDRISALSCVARFYLLQDQKPRALQALAFIAALSVDDPVDQLQIQLYHACCSEHSSDTQNIRTEYSLKKINVLIPCDTPAQFDAIQSQISNCCLRPEGWDVSFERCSELLKIEQYKAALHAVNTDILVIVQKNITIHNPMFFVEVARSLESCDVLSFAGAFRWQRVDWRADDFSAKVGSFFVTSSERENFLDIHCLGVAEKKAVCDLAILDGSLLAIKPNSLKNLEFDTSLLEAEYLLEEAWTHAAFIKGVRLAVHCNLGILVDQKIEINKRNLAIARMSIADKYKFDPFSTPTNAHIFLEAPVFNAHDGVRIVDNFLQTLFKNTPEELHL